MNSVLRTSQKKKLERNAFETYQMISEWIKWDKYVQKALKKEAKVNAWVLCLSWNVITENLRRK